MPHKREPKDAAVERLKKLDGKIGQAFIHGDRVALEAALADNMVLFNDGEIVGKKQDILGQIKPPPSGTKITVTVEKIDVFIFGSTAVVSSKATFNTEKGGNTQSETSGAVNTYSLRNAKWKLVTSQVLTGPPPEPPYSAKDVRFDIAIDPGSIKGNKNAAVVLLEFVDYQCPFCRRFAAETMTRLDADYVVPGRVALIVRDLPLEEPHPLAFGAAKAANCAAEQGKFWEMNDRLLHGALALAPGDLTEHANALRLDVDRFGRCMDDERTAVAIRSERSEASKFGIASTPVFLVGVRKPGDAEVKMVRMIEGAYPYDVFKATLDTVITARTQ
jgi:protein-disulfide isomerase